MQSLLEMTGYDTDKGPVYREVYESLFAPLREQPVRLLEVGVHRGGSLLLWRDYFPLGQIVGLDIDAIEVPDESGRIRVYQGGQQDTALLDRIGRENAPEGFDIVIDDASHVASLSKVTFWHLFERHLKPGGVYIIEDWGTGYWGTWPDGSFYQPASEAVDAPVAPSLFDRLFRGGAKSKPATNVLPSHQGGMVGFVKQLVDECAMGDITMPGLGISPPRSTSIRSVCFSHGQCVVRKAT